MQSVPAISTGTRTRIGNEQGFDIPDQGELAVEELIGTDRRGEIEAARIIDRINAESREAGTHIGKVVVCGERD